MNRLALCLLLVVLALPAQARFRCRDLWRETWILGARYDAAAQKWTRPIKDGDRISGVLERNLPPDFVAKYPDEVRRVLEVLRQMDDERFSREVGTYGAFDGREISMHPDKLANAHPIAIFLLARHETRHALTDRNAAYHDRLKLKGRRGMTRDEFIDENYKVELFNEAISYYDQILFMRKVAEEPRWREMVEAGLPPRHRELVAFLDSKKPAPGIDTINAIHTWLEQDASYREMARANLGAAYNFARRRYTAEELGARVNGLTMSEVIRNAPMP